MSDGPEIKKLLERMSKKELIDFIVDHPCNSSKYHSGLLGMKVRFKEEYFKKMNSPEYEVDRGVVFTITGLQFNRFRLCVFLDRSVGNHWAISINWLEPVEETTIKN